MFLLLRLSDLHQLIAGEPLRRREEERLAIEVHGCSSLDVRQRINEESEFTACDLCLGRTRYMLCFVERYDR